MDKLKPCPFCGSEPRCVEFNGLFIVVCGKGEECEVLPKTRFFKTAQLAIEAWNRRSSDA
jgi:hypothetical protein